MIELHNVRLALLHHVKDLTVHGQKPRSGILREIIGLDSTANFGSTLNELERDKGLLAKKKPKGEQSNIWSLTKKGEKYLKDNLSNIPTNKEVVEYFDRLEQRRLNKKSGKRVVTSSNLSSGTRTPELQQAMEGFTGLAQKNELYVAGYLDIHNLIVEVLGRSVILEHMGIVDNKKEVDSAVE